MIGAHSSGFWAGATIVKRSMTSSVAAAALGLALGLAAAAPAGASAFGTLAFTQPTGVVGPGDVIPVNLTLTLDQMSDALAVSNYQITSGGPTDAELTDAGFDLSQGVSTNLNVYFECSGTFTAVCADPPPYRFNFTFDSYAEINIAAGGTYDYQFGTFTPDPGPAAPGTYIFYNTGIFIQAFGFDANGAALHHDFAIAQTCTFGDERCAFTRTVEGGAVPEPASWAMMLVGFGGLGAMLRRQRRRDLATA